MWDLLFSLMRCYKVKASVTVWCDVVSVCPIVESISELQSSRVYRTKQQVEMRGSSTEDAKSQSNRERKTTKLG